MTAVPAELGAADARPRRSPGDAAPISALVDEPVDDGSWFTSAGTALWHLRRAFIASWISATVHLFLIIALAIAHGPDPLYKRVPPKLPIEATLVKELKAPSALP